MAGMVSLSDNVVPISSSESLLKDPIPPSSPPPSLDASSKKSLSFLKFGVLGAITGAAASAAYATYDTLKEVDEKTKALRESANQYTVGDDASALQARVKC